MLPFVRLSPWEIVYLVATLFCVVWISVLGIVLGAIGALHGYYEDRWWLMGAFALLAGIALGIELSGM
jgi:hypothetical protein